ncbi:hypothetical protein GGR50DRAFT_680558 [Xylaria sp. CBS 124048]|nr:hypothetical protein GGR50DRAFT_680558 [Xylaria sp. CBS 124048]
MAESEMPLTTTDLTTDLPSGDVIPTPLPAPDSSAPAPSKPGKNPFPLLSLLRAAPANLDAFLAHLQRCLSTPTGIDTVLLFVCYTSRLSASVLTSLVQPALQRSAQHFITLAASLPPSTTLLLTAEALPSTGVALVLELAKRLKALSAVTSEARTIMRLWGLLGMYFWAKRLIAKSRSQKVPAPAPAPAPGPSSDEKSAVAKPAAPQDDKFESTLAWSQLAACIVFQALENGAYLTSKGVLSWAPATQARAARWSARFWGSFVGLELVRLAYESARRGRRTRADKFAGGKTVALFEQEERDWSDNWRRSLLRNLAWAPLTVHWSLEQGLLPEIAVGALASVPSVLQIRQLWRSTAE